MITRKTIDEIFATARLEEVIGEFVQLKRSGSNLKGLSPFSDERTPSFMVSPAKQIWKDFSSGKGGNVVSFLMEHEQFTYPEALRWLANKYQIEIEEEAQSQENIEAKKDREELYVVTDFAKKFFMEQLLETEEGKNIGLSYFKERGFREEMIKTFELGYSPAAWEAFTAHALKKGFSKDILEKSGISIFKENKSFDRFRERVIFPIHSFSGRTLGFGARILRNDAKAAKYLNSPENDIYHKSKILYGIYQAKQEIIKQQNCLLVEGYTDVISLHQAGIKHVVASSGTALTQEQVRLVKRLTENITIIYDGDAAGIKASFRGIDLILEQEMNVKVLLLPEGHDPDSFAKEHGQQEIIQYLEENATDFIQFKTKVLWSDKDQDPVKKSEVIKELIQSIALIPGLVKRELYIRETARLLDVREDTLFNELARLQGKQQRDERRREKSVRQSSTMQLEEKVQEPTFDKIGWLEEELINLMLKYGDIIIEVEEAGENVQTTVIEEVVHHLEMDDLHLKLDFYEQVYQDVKEGLKQGELRTADYFLQSKEEELNSMSANALAEKYHLNRWKDKGIFVKSLEEGIEKQLEQNILQYKKELILEIIEQNAHKLKEKAITEEDKRLEALQKINRLGELKKAIDQHLNRVL